MPLRTPHRPSHRHTRWIVSLLLLPPTLLYLAMILAPGSGVADGPSADVVLIENRDGTLEITDLDDPPPIDRRVNRPAYQAGFHHARHMRNTHRLTPNLWDVHVHIMSVSKASPDAPPITDRLWAEAHDALAEQLRERGHDADHFLAALATPPRQTIQPTRSDEFSVRATHQRHSHNPFAYAVLIAGAAGCLWFACMSLMLTRHTTAKLAQRNDARTRPPA